MYEDNPASGDISNGYVSVTDITPNDLRGATCYVSPSLGGIVGNNDQPPMAKCLASFKNCMFYANTTSKHRYFLTLLGTGASTGLQVDDTVVINGVTYTGKSAETVASRQFKVFSGGSAAADIRDTCLSLIKVVNAYASAGVYGFYLSGANDVPGKMLFEERSVGGSAFAMTASRVTCFSPSSLPTSGTAETSTNEEAENALYYSKSYQPEAVPLLQYVKIGSAEKAILQIIPSRNALFIFKEDGIFRLTGDQPSNFTVDLLDDTAILIGSETPATINNQIMCLTTQGIVSVTDSGVSVLSRPIETDIVALFGDPLTAVRTYAFGIGYETDRKYLLFLPETSADTVCTQAYVYNTFTNTWTRWVMDKHCGAVNLSDDKLYLGSDQKNTLDKERKAYDFTDYVDYYTAETISSVASTYNVYVSNTDNIEVGDLLYQSSTVFGFVTTINTQSGYVTVSENVSWSNGAVDVYKAIDTSVKWAADTAGNPGALKHYSEVAFLFKRNFYGEASCTFSSDRSPGEVTVGVTGDDIGLWGMAPWGDVPWGGANLKTPFRVLVTRQHQRCSQLSVQFNHRWAYADWQLDGVAVVFNPGSTRISK